MHVPPLPVPSPCEPDADAGSEDRGARIAVPRPARRRAAPSASLPAPPEEGVALLEAQPELRRGIPVEELPMALRVLVVPRLTLPGGPWTPPAATSWPGPAGGLLVVSGLLARDVALGRRTSTQLLGPGDVLDPWGAGDEALPSVVHWGSATPTVLAVLDGRFAAAARRWPSLGAAVQARFSQRADRLATQAAILQLPSVEERIVAMLWQLAERFGRVRADAVVMPLALTHELLGQLVGARRSTVSIALKQLALDGTITRGPGGTWLLARGSSDFLAPRELRTV